MLLHVVSLSLSLSKKKKKKKKKKIRKKTMSTQHSPKKGAPGPSGQQAGGNPPGQSSSSSFETTVLAEMRELKGLMGGMMGRMTSMETRLEKGLAESRKAVGALED